MRWHRMIRCAISATFPVPGLRVTAEKFRDAVVRRQFNPFSQGLLAPELLQFMGGPAKAFQNWLPVVLTSATDWNLCSHCHAAIQPYLKATAPQPVSELSPAQEAAPGCEEKAFGGRPTGRGNGTGNILDPARGVRHPLYCQRDDPRLRRHWNSTEVGILIAVGSTCALLGFCMAMN